MIVPNKKQIHFEWDDTKNQSNIKKHRVSFEEAKDVFYDPFARLIHDPNHSDEEDRFILLGMSARLNILVVCHGQSASAFKDFGEITVYLTMVNGVLSKLLPIPIHDWE